MQDSQSKVEPSGGLSRLEDVCSGWPLWLIFVAVFQFAYFAYGPSLAGPFVYDDHEGIVANPDLRGGLDLSRFFGDHETSLHFDRRPVTGILAWLDFQIHGLRPFGFKLTSFFLHLATSCISFSLIRRLAARFSCVAPSVFAVACVSIWTLHPILTNSVGFVFQRSEMLMAFFYLAALLCLDFATEDRRSWRWRLAFVLCSVLSALSKEVGLTILVVAPVIERIAYFRSWGDLLRQRWSLYLGLGGAFAVLVVWISGGVRMTEIGRANVFWDNPMGYLKFQVSALAKYIRLVFWPDALIFVSYPTDWDRPTKWIPNLFFLLVLGGIATCSALRFKWVWICIAIFLGVLAPTTSIIPIPLEPYAEFRMYLPSMAVIVAALGLVAAVAHSREQAVRWLPWVWVAVPLLCLTLTGITRDRNHLYGTSSGLWEDVLRQEPTNGRALSSLGLAYLEERNLEGASACAARLLAEGSASDSKALLRVGMRLKALVAVEAGRPEDALPILAVIAEQDPTSESSQLEFAMAAERADRVGLARKVFDERIRGRFVGPAVKILEAEILIGEGRLTEASEVVGELDGLLPAGPRIASLRAALAGAERPDDPVDAPMGDSARPR